MNQKIHKQLSLATKIKKFVISSRPISWINTAFPFAAGYLATGGQVNWYFAVGVFYFLIPYNFLVYVVNDVFDYDSDVRNPRKNSIEGGLLEPSIHALMLSWTGAINIIPLLYLAFYGSLISNIVLLGIVLMALAYSVPVLRFKERSVIDSMTSSFHFVGPLIFSLVITGWSMDLAPYVIAFYLWGCASHAFGAVQDIIADRQARIHSIATHFGARATSRLSAALYLVSAFLLIMRGWPSLLVGVVVLTYFLAVLPYYNLDDTDAEQAHKGWQKFLILNQITGFVITIILILANI